MNHAKSLIQTAIRKPPRWPDRPCGLCSTGRVAFGSRGICPTCGELLPLIAKYHECTRGAVKALSEAIQGLEFNDFTKFGTPSTFAWWLASRPRQRKYVRATKRDPRGYIDWIISMPAIVDGWTWLRTVSYVSLREAEGRERV